MRDRDPRRAEWIEMWVRGIADEIRKKASGRDGEEFSLTMIPILQAIICVDGREKGRFGGHGLHIGRTSAELLMGYRPLRRHLKALAQAGIIMGVNWYDSRLKRRFPLEIILSPDFKEACGATKLGDARAYGKASAYVWLARRETGDDIQGFDDDNVVPWGRFRRADGPDRAVEVEASEFNPPKQAPREFEPSKVMEQVRAAAKGTHTSNALKDQLRKAKKDEDDRITAGAAKVWVVLQQRAGNNSGAPAWSVVGVPLSVEQAKERRALISIFRTYGGRTAAMAWNAFCGGKPEVDKNGKIAFMPQRAHHQWSTPDKRPTQFAKYINLVIDEVDRLGWADRKDYIGRLRSDYFGDVMDLLPAGSFGELNPKPSQNGDARGDQEATRT